MKTIQLYLTIALLCLTIAANATVRTVSNDNSGGAQYASLQAAYNAAVNGDTLMLEGTNSLYTMSTDYAKQLVIIGIGYNPTKSNPRKAIIYQMGGTFNASTLQTGGNGSKFYGIIFNSGTYLNSAINNYSYEDCEFYYNIDLNGQVVNNLSFRNCFFTVSNAQFMTLSTNFTQNTNIVFESCVFNNYINGSINGTSSLTFDHCLFLSPNTIFTNLQNAVIKNSIIMNNANLGTANTLGNTFTNNIFRIATALPVGNAGSGNVFSTDPLLVNYTIGAFHSTTFNYNLQSGSPAIGAGEGGSDCGVHGSTTHFSETGEVLIAPIVRNVSIQNVNTAPNGVLNVNVNATKPTDN